MRQWLVPALFEVAKVGLFFAAGALLLLGMLALR